MNGGVWGGGGLVVEFFIEGEKFLGDGLVVFVWGLLVTTAVWGFVVGVYGGVDHEVVHF